MKTLLTITISLLFITSQTAVYAEGYPDNRIRKDLEGLEQATEVDLSKIAPGQAEFYTSANGLVRAMVYRRTENDMEYLRSGATEQLRNPSSEGYIAAIEERYKSSTSEVLARTYLISQPTIEKTKYRSLDEEFFVASSGGPLGCAFKFLPPELRPIGNAPFMDVCTGIWYDVAGRALKDDQDRSNYNMHVKILAEANLFIPPHYFLSPTQLVIGLPPAAKLPELDSANIRKRIYERNPPIQRLAAATAYNDITEVRRCLTNGALQHPRPWPTNPLDSAIAGGSNEIVELLLENGAPTTDNSYELIEMVDRPELIETLERYKENFTDYCELISNCIK